MKFEEVFNIDEMKEILKMVNSEVNYHLGLVLEKNKSVQEFERNHKRYTKNKDIRDRLEKHIEALEEEQQ